MVDAHDVEPLVERLSDPIFHSFLPLRGEQACHVAHAVHDLYVVVGVRDHPFFEREGRDLLCEVPVPFVTAALGGEVDVPTLEAKVTLRVPEGTQSGKTLRLRGKGLPPLQPHVDASQLERLRGDVFVRIFVEVPTRLTSRQRDLLEEFAEETGTETSPASRSFVEKLRDLFD